MNHLPPLWKSLTDSYNFYYCRFHPPSIAHGIYQTRIISTIVDKWFVFKASYVYEAHLISTFVDLINSSCSFIVYEANLISTFVDPVAEGLV